jgi:hypothetical protein
VVFLFKDKSFINIFLLAILSIAIHFHFINDAPIVDTNSGTNDGLLSIVLDRYIVSLPNAIRFLLYHALVITQAIRLNLAMNELRMYPSNTFIPGMTYVLLTAIVPQWCSISPALVTNLLVIWIFIRLSRLYNHGSPKTLLFNTGFITGLSILCYHPMAILIGVVLFALAVVRPFRLAEWVILLLGVVLPYYFVFSWLYLNDGLSKIHTVLPDMYLGLPEGAKDLALLRGMIYLGLVLLFGLYFWQTAVGRMVIQIRKNWGVMVVMLLALMPVPFIFQQAQVESGLIYLVPVSAFAANAFSNPRRAVVPNLLFLAALVLIVWNNWVLMSK